MAREAGTSHGRRINCPSPALTLASKVEEEKILLSKLKRFSFFPSKFNVAHGDWGPKCQKTLNLLPLFVAMESSR